jgi:hypothetical protein
MNCLKDNWLLMFLAMLIGIAIFWTFELFRVVENNFGSFFPQGSSREEWGVLGDLFGGLLNPFFTFLGLIMLLFTLHQNQKKLSLSRKEFKESADALRCAPWRAKRRRVVPGRRGRERVAAVAKGRESRRRGGNMQGASYTPSSHFRALSCPAGQRGVGHGCDRRANPVTKGRHQGPGPRGSRMPPRGITRDTRLFGGHARQVAGAREAQIRTWPRQSVGLG